MKALRISGHRARDIEARQSSEYAGNWLSSDVVKRLYINPICMRAPDEDWLDYVGRKYFLEPMKKALNR